MALPAIHGLAVCAGAGGLELGCRLALGERYRCIAHVEREAYAAACLAARMQDGSLPEAPIWSDVATFDGSAFRDVVDLISGGPPCQPFSSAGKRSGLVDERWIWPDIARILREVRPRYFFMEEVAAFAERGMGHVLAVLSDLGFDAEWDVFSAEEVGAPHLRERLFVLGRDASVADDCIPCELANANGRGSPCGPGVDLCEGQSDASRSGNELADAGGGGSSSGADVRGRQSDAGGSGSELADPEHARRGELGPAHDDDGHHASGDVADRSAAALVRFPPRPTDPEDDWWEYFRAGGPEPGVRSGPDGVARRLAERGFVSRGDEIHTLGNGVVPIAAAFAFWQLRRRLT